jgi:hypothetical protein
MGPTVVPTEAMDLGDLRRTVGTHYLGETRRRNVRVVPYGDSGR